MQAAQSAQQLLLYLADQNTSVYSAARKLLSAHRPAPPQYDILPLTLLSDFDDLSVLQQDQLLWSAWDYISNYGKQVHAADYSEVHIAEAAYAKQWLDWFKNIKLGNVWATFAAKDQNHLEKRYALMSKYYGDALVSAGLTGSAADHFAEVSKVGSLGAFNASWLAPWEKSLFGRLPVIYNQRILEKRLGVSELDGSPTAFFDAEGTKKSIERFQAFSSAIDKYSATAPVDKQPTLIAQKDAIDNAISTAKTWLIER